MLPHKVPWRRRGTVEVGRMLPTSLACKLFLVYTACSALVEGYEMGFPSSHSHRTPDFSIQKTFLDINHLAVCVLGA